MKTIKVPFKWNLFHIHIKTRTNYEQKKTKNSFPAPSFSFSQRKQHTHMWRKYVHRWQQPGKKRQKNERGIKKNWTQQRCRRNHTWNEMSKLKFRNLLRMRGQTFTRIFFCNYYFGSPHSNFYFRLITRVSLSHRTSTPCWALKTAPEHTQWELEKIKIKQE